jgi:hypothetical protein
MHPTSVGLYAGYAGPFTCYILISLSQDFTSAYLKHHEPGTISVTTGIVTTLILGTLMLAVLGLTVFASPETRKRAGSKLVSTLFVGLIPGGIFLYYLDDGFVSDRAEDTVRQLFHVPNDVSVGRILGRGKQSTCHTNSFYRQARVQFSPEQFETYLASVHDQTLWRPVQPPHYSTTMNQLIFAGDALAWQELPEPLWMGDQQLVWKVANEQVRRGLAQCYDIKLQDQHLQPSAGHDVWSYSVTQCNPRQRPTVSRLGGRVTAALDFDKQRLNIVLHFASKPNSCNNRVTWWLRDALGFVAK